jgi:hypothetical protein
MFLLFLISVSAAIGLFEAVLIRFISRRVKGPVVPWRTSLYWSCVVVLGSGFLSSMSRNPHLPDSLALVIVIAGWVGLHVGLGGVFLTTQVRTTDSKPYPWRWGAKVTGIAGALLTVALMGATCVIWFVEGAVS